MMVVLFSQTLMFPLAERDCVEPPLTVMGNIEKIKRIRTALTLRKSRVGWWVGTMERVDSIGCQLEGSGWNCHLSTNRNA